VVGARIFPHFAPHTKQPVFAIHRDDRKRFTFRLQGHLEFGLIEALMGRRARRFFMGAEIPDGVLAYKSRYEPVPLSELEKPSWSPPAAATPAGTTCSHRKQLTHPQVPF
jgi:hypothetical protein